jgi:hypothetical protein
MSSSFDPMIVRGGRELRVDAAQSKRFASPSKGTKNVTSVPVT